MALETQYIVGRDAFYDFPIILRVILVNGTEVSRSEADFAEVEAAYPAVIEAYFNDIAAWSRDLSAHLDEQTEFAAETYLVMQKAWRFFGYFMQKFDYLKISSMPLAQQNTPEDTAADAPDSAEETQAP
jgi:hypothetical protein